MFFEWQNFQPNPAPVNTAPAVPSSTNTLALSELAPPGEEFTQQLLLKRSRLRANVDGDGSEHVDKKRSRHRTDVVTSRVNNPYATPDTHVGAQQAMKIGIWARQNGLGGNQLQKTAVLNSTRLSKLAVERVEQCVLDSPRPASEYDNVYVPNIEIITEDKRKDVSSTKSNFPPTRCLPRSSSPPDLLDYGFDAEDDSVDDEDETPGIYSDFSHLDMDGSNYDDNDFFDAFFSHEVEQLPLDESGQQTLGLILENEKQNAIAFAYGTL